MINLLLQHKVFSLIANVAAPEELVTIQIDEHFKMRLISQLINDISRVIQKLLNCFNDTSISTSFLLSLLGVFAVIVILDLNDS